jgi:hypothetical protein
MVHQRRPRGGRTGRGFDHGDEAVAIAPQRFDHLLAVPIIPHRLANEAHTAGQGSFGDKLARPARLQELLLGHRPVAMRKEVEEHGERLWLQREHLPVVAQLATVEIESAGPKDILHEVTFRSIQPCH